jgi:hypothetical protein
MEERMSIKIFWGFLRPNFVKTLFLLFLLAMTLSVVSGRQATSKVSWQENRGIPFRFVTLTGYAGPCEQNGFCREMNIQNFYPYMLVIDVIGWYLVSCALISGYETLKKQHSARKYSS